MKQKAFMVVFICALCIAMPWPSSAADNGEVSVAFYLALRTLDYYHDTGRVQIWGANLWYDSLLARDPQSGDMKAHLAESWRTVDDKTWEFKLRPNVKFHNGNSLTAEDVRFTIMEEILDPASKSTHMVGFNWIKDIKVIDDLTFQIITKDPYPLVIQKMDTLFILDKEWTKEMIAKEGRDYLANHANGSGPFKIAKFEQQGERIECVRNESYWNTGIPSYEKLIIRGIPEQSARLSELLAGSIYDDPRLNTDNIPLVMKKVNLIVNETPILRFTFLQFDSALKCPQSNKAVSDVRVRKAIWHAVDRKAIIKHVFGGHGTFVNIPANPISFGADSNQKGLEYNPSKAKALLKEAGYAKGLTLQVAHLGGVYGQFIEAANGYLTKVGVTLEATSYEGQTKLFIQKWRAKKLPDIVHTSWGYYNVFDVDSLWSYFMMGDDSPYNLTYDPEIEKLLREGRKTLDPEARKKIYSKAQKLIMDSAYMIPGWVMHQIHGTNKKFKYDLGVDEIPRYAYGKLVD